MASKKKKQAQKEHYFVNFTRNIIDGMYNTVKLCNFRLQNLAM
jgi:hypothetical protein